MLRADQHIRLKESRFRYPYTSKTIQRGLAHFVQSARRRLPILRWEQGLPQCLITLVFAASGTVAVDCRILQHILRGVLLQTTMPSIVPGYLVVSNWGRFNRGWNPLCQGKKGGLFIIIDSGKAPPPDIISYVVWRFYLSYRDIEDPLVERGITSSGRLARHSDFWAYTIQFTILSISTGTWICRSLSESQGQWHLLNGGGQWLERK